MSYLPVIGLEIHTELKTKTKMFCDCLNDPNEKRPNFNVCPVCTAQPGSLPVINREAVRMVIKTGLSLNCDIPVSSKFDRKNYFYPDLPKGYQISQYDKPFCKDGFLEINGKKIRIRRVHLEEDTGRLVHENDYSLVDFNRAGIPLMELVTEPDINSAIEARRFAEELQLILRYLDVSDADMEKGQMRVEVNISIGKGGKLGTKVEIKNLNSFKAVENAIDYEIKRQAKVLDAGEKVVQETRGWDDAKGKTLSQREKEEAHDYRYFPEPDLPPISFNKKETDEIRREIPELPQKKRDRFKKEYELEDSAIEILVFDKDSGEFFEKVVSEFEPRLAHEKIIKLIKLSSNYLISDLKSLLKDVSPADSKFLITPENFAEFITLIEEGKISSKIAKMILGEMFKSGADPSHVIDEKGLALITDESEIENAVRKVISKNQKAVADYKAGRENALQFLIGQVMAETKGKTEPETAKKILKDLLRA